MERFLKSRYKIGEKISENPYSVTYKGSFLGNDKPLVIKIYKRATLNSSLISRMKEKVKTMVRLNHHGIVKLIDGDYGWQGFYYVREFVKGQSLKELIESGEKFELERSLPIIEEVCLVLEAAHTKGIIHGGLKPSNIFIDKKGIVKVADFVIEGEIKQAMPQKVLSIMTDGKYTAPDELAGLPASSASDIFSLGMILHEIALNKLPLSQFGLMGGLAKLRRRPMLSEEDVKDLPKYLQDVIAKALNKDPLLRFSTATEMRESLEKKSLVLKARPLEDYINLFDNTVTQYGAEELDKKSKPDLEERREKLNWGKEKHRYWILGVVLLSIFFFALLYIFMFGW